MRPRVRMRLTGPFRFLWGAGPHSFVELANREIWPAPGSKSQSTAIWQLFAQSFGQGVTGEIDVKENTELLMARTYILKSYVMYLII